MSAMVPRAKKLYIAEMTHAPPRVSESAERTRCNWSGRAQNSEMRPPGTRDGVERAAPAPATYCQRSTCALVDEGRTPSQDKLAPLISPASRARGRHLHWLPLELPRE